MATRTGRKIAHFAPGGALDGTAQGMPAATGALGYTPGPETNAAGSWGAAATSGGIAGDPSISPVGAPDMSQFNALNASNPVAPTPALPAAAPNVAATGQSSEDLALYGEKGGAIPGEGGAINPTEEPYRQKWRAKNGKKQAPYRAYDEGGAIPDTPDVPVDQDQGQEGQAGDELYQGVAKVLSDTRKQFGLTDSAFQKMNQELAGNMPTVPGSQSSGPPPRFPLPAGVPGSGGFGTKGSLSQNNDDDSNQQAVS